MAVWFWYFIIYSFLGFCLEVAAARAAGWSKRDRKCFLLLPLCPVYGVGALLILAALPALEDMPLAVAAWSGISATAAEYVTSLFYEKALRVSFWDYSGLTWNLHGRVCLGFSLCWCVLGLVVVYLIHPLAAYAAARLPGWLFSAAGGLVAADGLITAVLLRRAGDAEVLRWYRAIPAGRNAQKEDLG